MYSDIFPYKWILGCHAIFLVLAVGCSFQYQQESDNQIPQSNAQERLQHIRDNPQEWGTTSQRGTELTESYIGKHLLVGLTYRNGNNKVIEHIQLHGKITRITKEGIFFNRSDGTGEFAIPPDLQSLKPAIQGAEYRLKSTGEVAQDVDYICRYTITE